MNNYSHDMNNILNELNCVIVKKNKTRQKICLHYLYNK